MRSIECKGKSVDEAVFRGITELGVSLDDVDIDIVQEGGRGFLGLGRSAVVRLTVRETPPQAPEPFVEEMLEEEDEYPITEVVSDEIIRAQEEETAECAQAREFLQGVIDRMHLKAECTAPAAQKDGTVRLEISGQDTAALIGRRGDTLDALQYLTGLVINKGRDEYVRVMLDAENYRSKREAALEKLARRLAGNVMRNGRPVRLEPMNPYERRIMHAALQDDPNVETYSEGTDPNRRVVIRRRRRSHGHNE
ncbi:MAG: KH domain-containing protein [Clostridia bacterium]|nr:KH domain-containing protein [Clostridia bacterium]